MIGLFAVDQLYRANNRAIEGMLEERRAEYSHFLDSSIKLQGTELKTWVASFSWWDEAVNFVAEPDTDWASENIDMMGGGDTGRWRHGMGHHPRPKCHSPGRRRISFPTSSS